MKPEVRRSARTAFTLVEVVVTILIVGMTMLWVLQGLNTAKLGAAQTRNLKLSRELALLTLGQISSGQYQDDIENGLRGSYAEEGYPDFEYQVVVGDDSFDASTQEDATFDSWRPRTTTTTTDKKDDKDKKDQEDQPYEKVKIKVTFPTFHVGTEELKHELVLEQWIPWAQVYGAKEDDSKSDSKSSSSKTSSTPAAGGTKP